MHRYFGKPCNNGNVHGKPARKRADVTGAVGAGLEHHPLRIATIEGKQKKAVDNIAQPAERILPRVRHTEYSQRKSDFAVKTFFALTHMVPAREYGVYRVFGRR